VTSSVPGKSSRWGAAGTQHFTTSITGLNFPGETARARGCPLIHAQACPNVVTTRYEAPQGIRGRYPRVSSPSVLGG
jgi:hypothetical protein